MQNNHESVKCVRVEKKICSVVTPRLTLIIVSYCEIKIPRYQIPQIKFHVILLANSANYIIQEIIKQII